MRRAKPLKNTTIRQRAEADREQELRQLLDENGKLTHALSALAMREGRIRIDQEELQAALTCKGLMFHYDERTQSVMIEPDLARSRGEA